MMVAMLACTLCLAYAHEGRTTISLNGEWKFEQTETAFPPAKFTRKIPVPGLIHLAVPKIDDYDRFFIRPERVKAQEGHNVSDRYLSIGKCTLVCNRHPCGIML